MAKGYWMARISVVRPEAMAEYRALSSAAVEEFGGRFLARGGDFEVVEGASRERHVIIEFPSYAEALTAYRSETYARARAARDGAADFDLVITEGVAED